MGPRALGIPAQGPRPIIVLWLNYSDPVFEVTPHGIVGVTLPPFFKNEVYLGHGTKKVEGPREPRDLGLINRLR